MTLSALALTTPATVRLILGLPVLATPGTPTVTPQGTPGNVAYSYKLVAIDATTRTAAGAAGSTATGAATLNNTNFNRVTWAAVPRATGYLVYRTVGGPTQGKIATLSLSSLALDDVGLTGDGLAPPAIADDSLLEGDIDAISALMEGHTRHVLASRTFTGEVMDGTGKSVMRLTGGLKAAYPVTSLAALTLYSSDGQVSLAVDVALAANEIRVERATGRLTLLAPARIPISWSVPGGRGFPLGHDNIVGTFTAGYTLADYPAERRMLERLAIAGLQWLWSAQTSDPTIRAKSIGSDGGLSIQYGDRGAGDSLSWALPVDIQRGLMPFMAYSL